MTIYVVERADMKPPDNGERFRVGEVEAETDEEAMKLAVERYGEIENYPLHVAESSKDQEACDGKQ